MRPQLNWIERLTTDQKVVDSISAGRAIEIGMQLSLVEHLIWDQGVTGSNPAIPTIVKWRGSLVGQSARFIPGRSWVRLPPSLPLCSNRDPQLSWLELPAHNRSVVGSSPTGSTIKNGGIPKWLKGPVLKTGRSGNRRLGSNPSSSAIKKINIARQSSLVARRAHNPEVGGSNPPLATNGPVAQSVEQWTENPCVAGSIPAGTTISDIQAYIMIQAFFLVNLLLIYYKNICMI